jgi:hypothetical protein
MYVMGREIHREGECVFEREREIEKEREREIIYF